MDKRNLICEFLSFQWMKQMREGEFSLKNTVETPKTPVIFYMHSCIVQVWSMQGIRRIWRENISGFSNFWPSDNIRPKSMSIRYFLRFLEIILTIVNLSMILTLSVLGGSKLFDFYYNSFCRVFPKKLGRFYFGLNFTAILSDQVGRSYSYALHLECS